MGSRYHGLFKSVNEETQWRVEIHDAAFSGVSQRIELAAPGFQITYEGDGGTLFQNQIKGSRATIFVAPTDGTISSFFQSLSANQETDLVVKIFKNGSTMADLHWIGTVLCDLITYPKEHVPYVYSLQAIDGLARLENFEFTYATNSANPEKLVLCDAIAEALKYTGLYSHFAITDTFIRFSENWFELDQSTARSTFIGTRAKRLNFLDNYDPLQPDNLKALNCREVIEVILKTFGAKIEFSRGSYRVFSINNAVTSSITEYNYAYDGVSIVYLSTTTLSPQLTINTNTAGPPRVLAGANWAYRRPILNCRVETESQTSVAVYKAYNTTALNVNCGNFDGSLATKDMILAGKLTFDNSTYTKSLSGVFIWTITVGSGGTQVWLKRETDGSLTWTNVAWTVDTEIPIENFVGRNSPVTIGFELKIPALTTPNTGDIVIGCVYKSRTPIILGGKTWTTPNLTVSAAKFDLRLIQGSGTSDVVYSGKVYANVENTDNPDNSVTEVIKNRFCDGSKYRLQSLEIWNGAAWEYSNAWDLGIPSGGGTTLTDLLAFTVVAYQKDGFGQKVLQGGIIGDIDCVSAPVIDTAVYYFNSGTFTAMNDTMDGEWILLSYDNTGLNLTTGDVNIDITREELHDRKIEELGGQVGVLNYKVGNLPVVMVDAILNTAYSGTPTSAPAVGTRYQVEIAYQPNADGDDQMQFNLSPASANGELIYYWSETNSEVATYYKQLDTPASTNTLTFSAVTDGQLLVTFITDPSNPLKTFLPDGVYSAHIHAAKTSGTKDAYLNVQIWEVNASGVDVAQIATLGNSTLLSGASAEYYIADAVAQYDFASAANRIAAKVYVDLGASGSAPDIDIYVGGTADSRINLPAPYVNVNNYVPYTGATSALDMDTKQVKANAFVPKFTTTATAAGTTTLTLASTQIQEFTGTTTQTITLPVTSTLSTGQTFRIINNSTGALTVNSSGGNLVQTIAAASSADLTCILTSGTTAASWDSIYTTAAGGGSGVTTMAAIGATPNANGASISGTTLTLQPADGTYGGVLTNTTQDIAGSKRFTNATTRFTSASATVDLYGVSNFNGGFQIYAEWAIRRTPTSGGQANCIGIGTALNTTFTGYYNIAIGDNSMAALTSGVRNCSIGLAAMQSLTSGTDNMAIGKDSMKLITTGYSNVAIGSNSLYLQSTRNNNTAIGESAGYAVDGNKNVHIGAYTSYDSGSGTLRAQNNNVIIGYQAGFQNRGDGNIYLGYQAGYSETTNSNLLIISNEYNDFLIKGSLVATKWVDINGQLRLKDVTTNTNTPSGATAKYIKIYDQAGTAYYVPAYAAAW